MTEPQATALADRPPGSTIPGAPVWLSMQEAADYLRVPYNSLAQKWRKWGIPSYKIGRDRRFLQVELDAWLKSRREDPAAEAISA